MRGIIFTVLNKMVEEKLGLQAWEEILERVHPPSMGAYTAADNYADNELFALVHEVSNLTKLSLDETLVQFGQFTLPQLALQYPVFFQGVTAKEFLKSIDGVIHVEVKKLYPDADLPKFNYEDPAPNKLIMLYQSRRKLCRLAEGLIDGTANQFQTTIKRQQTRCMLQGHDHCRIELEFGN